MKRKNFILTLFFAFLFLWGCNPSSELTGSPSGSKTTTTSNSTGHHLIANPLLDRVSLSWDPVSDAMMYSIFNTTSGNKVFVAVIPAAKNTYTVTGLLPNSSYKFRVESVDSNGVYDGNTDDVIVSTINPALKKIAILGDNSHTTLETFLLSKGFQVDNYPENPPSKSNIQFGGNALIWEGWSGELYFQKLNSPTIVTLTTTHYLSSGSRSIINENYVVWVDGRNPGNGEVYGYDINTGTEFLISSTANHPRNFSITNDYVAWEEGYLINVYQFSNTTKRVLTAGSSELPSVDGTTIVWQDYRSGWYHIYGYNLLTDTEFQITNTPSSGFYAEIWPKVSGDYVVWRDHRNGGVYNLYGYKISTTTEFQVSLSTNIVDEPKIEGDYIVWTDSRHGHNEMYGYKISTATEYRITNSVENKNYSDLGGGNLFWYEYDVDSYTHAYVYNLDAATSRELSWGNHTSGEVKYKGGVSMMKVANAIIYSNDLFVSDKNYIDSIFNNILTYDAILWGDVIDYAMSVELFTLLDGKGIDIVSIGTHDNDSPLGRALNRYKRLGILEYDDYGSAPMEINATDAGKNHLIFTGIDTDNLIVLEDSGASAGEMDEQSFDCLGGDCPPVWIPLATMGSNMNYAGYDSIIEFKTINGTTVILDGSASSYENYVYWNQTRWDLLINELIYVLK